MSYYSDAIFFIEVRDYGRAAEAMICEVFGEKFIRSSIKSQKIMTQRVAKELKIHRDSLRNSMDTKRLRPGENTDIAEEAYQRTYDSLNLYEYDENLIEL